MPTIERTPDTAESLCPICGIGATTSSIYVDQKIGYNEAWFLCKESHIFIVRWMVAG